MKFIAKKPFSSVRYGNVSVGDSVPVDGSIAKQMIDAGMIEPTAEYLAELRAKREAEAKTKKVVK